MAFIHESSDSASFDLNVWRKAERNLAAGGKIQIFQCPLLTNELKNFKIQNNENLFTACVKFRFTQINIKKNMAGGLVDEDNFNVIYGPEWFLGESSPFSMLSINYFNYGNDTEYEIFPLRSDALTMMLEEANGALGSANNIFFLRAILYNDNLSKSIHKNHVFYYLEKYEDASLLPLNLEPLITVITSVNKKVIEIELSKNGEKISGLMPFSCGSRIPPDPSE